MARPLSLEEFRREISDEASARRLLERLVWPQGPYCPRCGSFHVWRFRNEGRRSRDGLLQCGEGVCGRQFTATTLTPLHATKLPLRVWLEAIYLVLTSSKGVSSVVLARQIGVKQATAWKMGHAIRALMARWHDAAALLVGIVEVDTKRIGGAPRRRRHVHNPRGKGSKKPIVLVAADRGGQVKAAPVPDERAETLQAAIHRFVDRRAGLMSDADKALMKVGRDFASHDTVNHGRGALRPWAEETAHPQQHRRSLRQRLGAGKGRRVPSVQPTALGSLCPRSGVALVPARTSPAHLQGAGA